MPRPDVRCHGFALSYVRRNSKYHIYLAICVVLVSIASAILGSVSELSFFRSTVENVSDREVFLRETAAEFASPGEPSADLAAFRSQLPFEIKNGPPNLATAIKVRHWVRLQQPDGDSWKPQPVTFRGRLIGPLDDPVQILHAQRQGAPANCRQFSFLMAGAIESAGMRGRVVIASGGFWKWCRDGHVMTDVWIPMLRKWVLMDSMWDVMYTVDGKPASALETYDAARQNRADRIAVVGYDLKIRSVEPDLIRRQFKHLYFALTNTFFDGYRVCLTCNKQIRFAHYSNSYSSSYPSFQKKTALSAGCLCLVGGFGFLVAAAFIAEPNVVSGV
jgi:hypothetical protein